MPRVEFKEENIKKNDYDYPKLKLDKGETSRIVLLEDPVGEFVHTIEKPKLVNGVPQKETKKRRDGTEYKDYVYEFVTQALCLGDYGTLEEDGSDPDHCPICAEAAKSDRFKAPKRRFAMHVVRYEVKPGTSTVKEPFSASTVIWSFTERVFNELFSFKKEWGDLRAHDLILHREPTTAMSGVYKISVAQKAAWMESEKTQEYVKGLMVADNLAPDLSIFCGSRKSEKNLEYDIRAVTEAWNVATGVTTVSANDAALSGVGSSLTLDTSLDELINASSAAPAAEETWHKEEVEPAVSLDELGLGDSSEESESAEESSAVDIDALLKGL